MTRVRNFVADLAKAGKRITEIQEMVKNVYQDKALSRSQIYRIMKQVKAGKNTEDQRPLNAKKTVRTDTLVAAVTADIEKDRRINIQDLASAHGTSFGTIYRIIHTDLGLVKKSARWVPKLLSEEQMAERVRTSTAFVKMIRQKGKSVLGNIITMDETAVSMHTPETKSQSKQWPKRHTRPY